MILLRNCNIINVEKKEITLKDILIEGKIIKKIGSNIEAYGCEEKDLKGAYVCSGFIDIATQIGLVESGSRGVIEGDDANEIFKEVIPGMQALNGIYPYDISFKEALNSGVTKVVVNSGDYNVIGAQSCLLNTGVSNLHCRIINPAVDIKATLGDAPKKWNFNSQSIPLSRMGIINLLRKCLLEAKEYMEHNENINLDYEALARIIKREIPLKITANKAQDIFAAIDIKEEFDIDLIIDGCAEGYMLKEYIKEADIKVILNSALIDVSSLELMNSRDDNAKLLMEEGIITALSTHHPKLSSELLLFSAAMLMREGLDMYEVLSLITINPAKILNLDDEMGSIQEGKLADILAFDDVPVKTQADIVMTMVDGVQCN